MELGKVTTRALAAELGLSHSAVAAALRGDRRVSAATRERVCRHAAARGYVRNPAAAALAAQRKAGSAHPYNVALITAGAQAKPGLPLYAGCARFAAELGYGFEYLHLGELRQGRSLDSVLQARGVGGVVIDTLASGMRMAALSELGVPIVKVHDGLPDLVADMVTFDQYRQTREAFRRAWERGRRRIGFTLPATSLIRSANQVRRSALLGIHEAYGLPFSEVHLYEAPHPLNDAGLHALVGWIGSRRLDCVVLHDLRIAMLARQKGMRIPEDLGVCGLHLDAGRTLDGLRLSGFTMIPQRLAEAAVRVLDSRIRETGGGLVGGGMTILVQPDWVEGETL